MAGLNIQAELDVGADHIELEVGSDSMVAAHGLEADRDFGDMEKDLASSHGEEN